MSKIPSYRRHKASGQAVVTLSGRDIYLGAHGTPASRAEYERVVAEWLAAGRTLRPRGGAITVAELVEAYWAFAQTYYVKDGRPTSQQERVKRSLAVVTDLYGLTPAADFGPLRLKAARERMVERGWTRTHVNHCVGCVKRAFKWAVAEELVPPGVFEGLRAVDGLRKGRGRAREGRPVSPAPEGHVRAAQAAASPQVRDMIELQLWTGMRSGEVCRLRPCDLDRSGRARLPFGEVDLGPGVWVYVDGAHKAAHHGHQRVVLLGPQAQAALAPYLSRGPESHCFSPAEAEAWRQRQRRAARKTPVQPSQLARAAGRAGKARKRPPGGRFTPSGYAHAVRYACAKAGVPPWHPHQLRHNAATRLVSLFGWDIARILLGHRSVEVTRVYAADDLKKAAGAARAAC